MELGQLVERLSAKVELHESEAAAFAQEAKRGRDFFESECARNYHDGGADAVREILDLLSMLYVPDDSATPASPSVPSKAKSSSPSGVRTRLTMD